MERPPWFWRVAACLLPASFRVRHGRELELDVAEQLEGRGLLGRAFVWAGALADVVRAATRLQWAARRGLARGAVMTLDGTVQDLGFAFRALRRRPGFTLVAVLTLAIGIGAVTTLFSVVNGVLLRPLPYADAERIGVLWHEFGDGAQNLPAVHALDGVDYREWSGIFESFTLATGREWILGGEEDPELVEAGLVEAGFFEFFGAEPLLGRTIRAEEDVPGVAPVVVLSQRVWERRFGGDPGVVGREIDVAGSRMEVVGVMADAFRLYLPAEAFLLRDADIWVSLRLNPEQMPPRNFTAFTAFGRLRRGATFAQAQAELEVLEARLKEQHSVHAASNLQVRVVPLLDDVVKGTDRVLLLLFGAVGFVLLIACANVANLVTVRGQSRRAELAVRSALGAGRGQLVRLGLLESALLAGAGAGLGLLISAGLLEAVRALGPAVVPRLDMVRIDGAVLAFAMGAGAISVALFGVLPALRATDQDPGLAMHVEARTGERRRDRRFRDVLVVAEVAASLVLLVGTGLVIRSFDGLGRVDPGFEPEGALTFRINLPVGRFADVEARRALERELTEALEALPGARAVGFTSQLPLTGSGTLQPYAYDEQTASAWETVTADGRRVSPGIFDALGARFVQGQTFTGQDAIDRGTIIIDDRLAARAFPGRDAVGQRLQVESDDTPEEIRYATVVGVVEHIRIHELSRPHLTQIYFPQSGSARFSVVIRTSGNPAELAPGVRAIVRGLAPGAPVEDLRTLTDLVSASMAPLRLTLTLMSVFGAVALLLASVGIYGVLSYSVSQRTREIGVRMALGQTPHQVERVVIARGGRVVAIALVLGIGASVFLSRVMEGVLYGVESLDPATYATTSAVLVGVSLLACWIPARRATRVDPVTVLRH